MAPEVYLGERYNQTVDIYSLGMILYWLLNEQKPPFLREGFPLEDSHYKRFHGEPLPAPKNGSAELKKLVLKACSFDPRQRFASASEMLEALQALPAVSSSGFGDHFADAEPESDETFRVVPVMHTNKERRKTEPPAPEHAAPPQHANEPAPPRSEPASTEKQPIPAKKTTRKSSLAVIALACIGLLALILMLSFCGKNTGEPEAPDALSLPGFAEFGGRYYCILDTPLTSYEAAAAFCRELGGHMADVNSEEENRFLYEYLRSTGYAYVYLGGSDAREDGVWEWESGEPFSYQNWNEGEPNNDLGGEDHLAMYQLLTDGSWNDLTYTAPTYFDGTAMVLGVEASSYCTDPQKNCSANHLIDEDPATAWCTSGSDAGTGESILFEFQKRERLTGFSIHSGNQSDSRSFENCRRPGTIRLVFDDGTFQTFALEDRSGEQYISFDSVVVTATVKMVIESAYGSDEGNGIAASGMLFHIEDRKVGFLCEWESEAAAKAAAKKLPEIAQPKLP